MAGRLAAAIDGTTIVAAAPTVVHRSGRRRDAHDGRVRRGLSIAIEARHNCAPTMPERSRRPLQERRNRSTARCGVPLLVARSATKQPAACRSRPTPTSRSSSSAGAFRARRVVALTGTVVVDARPCAPGLANPSRPTPGVAHLRRSARERAAAYRVAATAGARIAFTVAARRQGGARWGDWHLAQAFARSLRKLGHVVQVQTLDHADDLAVRVRRARGRAACSRYGGHRVRPTCYG